MLEDTLNNMVAEEGPTTLDLSKLAAEVGGAWPVGWYAGKIIEGYSTNSGKQWVTEDTLSKAGDSHNLRICFLLRNKEGEARSTWYSYNYRAVDFSADRLEAVMNLRKEFAGQRGKWVGHEDVQRSSLALGKLGQLQKAGVPLSFVNGVILTTPMIGRELDVRLGMDAEDQYNEVTAVATLGTAGRKPKAAGGAA